MFLCIAKQKSINSIYLWGHLERHKDSEEKIIRLITKACCLYSNFQTMKIISVAESVLSVFRFLRHLVTKNNKGKMVHATAQWVSLYDPSLYF